MTGLTFFEKTTAYFLFAYFASGSAVAGWFGPSNYENCILEAIKTAKTAEAVKVARDACWRKFPPKKQTEPAIKYVPLTTAQLSKLNIEIVSNEPKNNGLSDLQFKLLSASARGTPFPENTNFILSVYNGNEKIDISDITIEVTIASPGWQPITRHYKSTSGLVKALSTGALLKFEWVKRYEG